MEQSFRQAVKISDGSLSVFFGSAICVILIILTIVSILYPFIRKAMVRRRDLGIAK